MGFFVDHRLASLSTNFYEFQVEPVVGTYLNVICFRNCLSPLVLMQMH